MAEAWYLCATFILILCTAPQTVRTESEEVDAEVISSSKVNLTRPFSDVENFSRINSWTSKGLSWSGEVETTNQFNLTQPPSEDKYVIICFTQSRSNTLEKDFSLNGPLINANFTMKYYVRIFDRNFTVKGMLFDSENASITHELFNFDHDHFSMENNSWVTFTATDGLHFVPANKTNKNFTVRLEFWSTSMIYDADASHYQFVAFDELSLTGDEKITNLPQVTTKAPVQTNTTVTVPPTAAPAVNKTTVANYTVLHVNVTTPAPSANETVVPSGNNETVVNTTDGINNTNATEASSMMPTSAANNTNIVEPTDASGHNQDGQGSLKEEVEKVAKAIWDAFYVFLALFCACLIALIILIYKARNSRDEAPPSAAVATYNPRTASYRLDSSGSSSHYDNPGFRNEAV